MPLCEGELNQQRLSESAAVSRGSGREEAVCAVLVALVGLMSPSLLFFHFLPQSVMINVLILENRYIFPLRAQTKYYLKKGYDLC